MLPYLTTGYRVRIYYAMGSIKAVRTKRLQRAGKGRSNKMSKAYNKIVEKRLQEKRPLLQNKSVAKNKKASSSRRAPLQAVSINGVDCTRSSSGPHRTHKQGRGQVRRKEPAATMRPLPPSKEVRRVTSAIDQAFDRLVLAGEKGARSLRLAVRNFNRLIAESRVDTTTHEEYSTHHV